MTEKETDCSIKGTTKYIFVAPRRIPVRGDGQGNRVRIPNGTAAVCVESVLVPLAAMMKIRHWGTGKAKHGGGAKLPGRESEDLLGTIQSSPRVYWVNGFMNVQEYGCGDLPQPFFIPERFAYRLLNPPSALRQALHAACRRDTSDPVRRRPWP